MIEGKKVLSPQEMKRLDSLFSAEELMEKAALGIAAEVERLFPSKKITLLIGKGNNGADTLLAGVHLLKKGFSVKAVQLFPFSECSPLCQKQQTLFQQTKGVIHLVSDASDLNFEGIILDGICGTGFRGTPEGIFEQAVRAANHSRCPIVAIDIPSGLSADSGEVCLVSIKATYTLYLGFPKLGFFIGEGWNHVGKLIEIDIGLPENEAKASAHLIAAPSELKLCLPEIKRNRHKYDAGYVLALAGSFSMPGASMLCTHAILRSGAGIVRHFYPPEIELQLYSSPYEVIREPIHDTTRIIEEADRADAMVIGPGLGKSKEIFSLLKKLIPLLSLPLVIDGDGLTFLSEHPKIKLPPITILTPHHGEMDRLLDMQQEPQNKKEWLQAAQAFVDAKEVISLLKGGPTFLLRPKKCPLIIPFGDPGMATAGMGDLLAGMIASFIAQGCDALSASSLAAYLHAKAGEYAAKELTSYCMMASDLFDFLPKAFVDFL